MVADAVDHSAGTILLQQAIMDGEDIGLLVKASAIPPSQPRYSPRCQASAAVELPPAKSWEQTSGTALQPTRKAKLASARGHAG